MSAAKCLTRSGISSGRSLKRWDVDPFELHDLAVQLLEQFPPLDKRCGIILQGDDQPDVDLFIGIAADPAGLSFIHEAEDLHLVAEACFFQFLDEDGASVSLFEEAAF